MQSLSRWTKLVLTKAGLGQFTVHSGISASSSCALLLGMPINAILRYAGWKSKSSFVCHYMKHTLTAVTDKHGFSKNWESKLGEGVKPCIDGRVQCFLAHSEVDHVFCRDAQSAGVTISTCQTAQHRSPSTSIQIVTPQLSSSTPLQTRDM